MTYTARVTVSGDRRLVIDLPAEMATGDVEVTVTPIARDGQNSPGYSTPQLAPLFEKWERERRTGSARTEEERLAELFALRDVWDAAESELPPRGTGAALLLLDKQLQRAGWRGTGRTKEEIDHTIRDLRDEWDDD